MVTDIHSLLLAGKLVGTRRLDLCCGLTEFPVEIFELADSLEILNLSGNKLDSLPDDLYRLHKLKAIFCSDNRFIRLPSALGLCKTLDMVAFKANQIQEVPSESLPAQLRWLILTDNRIQELPAELGRRPRLQKLMLAGNRLKALPDSLAACHKLELLRISANRLEALPSWIPRLPRLAWIAYGANPFCDRLEKDSAAQNIEAIEWRDIELRDVLGEGASGVIYQALQVDSGSQRPVAVKIFKGAVTSDGLPESEWAACASVGTHPTLIGSAGRISGHPEGRHGLVMPLIPPSYQVLAGPPSLDSCTRDVYAQTTRLAPNQVLQIALDMASAAAHLHRSGVLHGDLYAHNILVDEKGHAFLGDFGAASFIDETDKSLSAALKRLEVRAFGCLLEELVAQCQGNSQDPALLALDKLAARCLDTANESRPLFDEIHAGISRLTLLQSQGDDQVSRVRPDPESRTPKNQPAARQPLFERR